MEAGTDELVARIQAATEVTEELVNSVSSFLDTMLVSLRQRSR